MDSFIVLFTRWRVADDAACAAERRLARLGAGGDAGQREVQVFVAAQLRAVAGQHYRALRAALEEMRARLPLL
jgi:hypothetical protein